jgi:hypothetical protein
MIRAAWSRTEPIAPADGVAYSRTHVETGRGARRGVENRRSDVESDARSSILDGSPVAGETPSAGDGVGVVPPARLRVGARHGRLGVDARAPAPGLRSLPPLSGLEPRWRTRDALAMRFVTGLTFALVVSFFVAGCGTAMLPPTDDAGTTNIDAAMPMVDAAPTPVDAAPPSDAGAESCTMLGATEMVPCGTCGTVTRFCATPGVWTYGACTEHGACSPGSIQTVSCGRCGTHQERCGTDCTWDTSDPCTGETGSCTPGETMRTTVDCPAGESRLATCDATCMLAGGTCSPGECTPGMMMTAHCGFCGLMTRTCNAMGAWVDGTCADMGECTPGAMDTVACDVCGTMTRNCSAECLWGSTVCTGGVTCPPVPAATCVDATTLRRYDPTPMCMSGACGYAAHTVTCSGGCTSGACAGTPLETDLGGTLGFGTLNIGASDDGSSPAITLPGAGFLYYGTTYTQLFQNNNGNVSFGMSRTDYTPNLAIAMGPPVIAPWWADVDSRATGIPMTNYVGWFADSTRVVATWWRVGYYASHQDLMNSFQVILTARSDVAPGDFDVELRYNECEWTTGDASGGSGGLGGTPAGAGFSAADGTRSLALPGSGTAAVLNLCTTSNVGMPGIWRFQVRGGIPM